MQQLEKWMKELDALSERRFKETDSELFEVYRKSLVDIKKRLYDYAQVYDQLSFSSRLEVDRYFSIAKEIDAILSATYSDVENAIKDYSANQAEQGYYGVWYSLEQSQKLELQMPLINHDLIESLVNKPVAGKRLSKRLYEQRDKLAKNATNNIIEGLFAGEEYAKIAKKISDQTEATYQQALRIAITEGGRTQSETSQKSAENAKTLGIEMQKRWLSTLDNRTRKDHQDLDGQTIEIEEEFTSGVHKAMAPRLFGVARLDIRCRCTTINIVEGISPELRKDNESKEYIEYLDYGDWLAQKTVEQEEK